MANLVELIVDFSSWVALLPAIWARGADGVEEDGWGTLRLMSLEDIDWALGPVGSGLLRNFSGAGLLVEWEGFGEVAPLS
jgi:hypothetical protein